MTQETKTTLRKRYDKAVNAYRKAFCSQFGIDEAYSWFVGDDTTGVLCYNDEGFVNVSDMIYCVDNGVTSDEYERWSDYNIKAKEYGFSFINLPSWHKGAPHVSEETFDKLKSLRDEFTEIVNGEF